MNHDEAALRAALQAFPPDAAKVFECLSDGEYVQSALYVSRETGVPEDRVKAIHRALRTLGFASFGTLQREDDGVTVGSGYWATWNGEVFRSGLRAVASDEAAAA